MTDSHSSADTGAKRADGKPDTGGVCYDLPSPYLPHTCGLLHLPRFLAKIEKHLAGELPQSYQRNFTRGFDGFLCLHLGIEPQQVIEIVRACAGDLVLRDQKLAELFPDDLRIAKWNRELVQKGLRGMGRETLVQTRQKMGIPDREDLASFADMIEFDENRID